MKETELYEKAQLLKAGQIVEIAGNWFRAIKLDNTDFGSCCVHCQIDCICHDDVLDVCCEMETGASQLWYLKLASDCS